MYQRVKIYPYQIGLVFEGDSFVATLVEGTHWLRTNKEVRVHNRTTKGKVILPPTPPDILLTDAVFRANIIELKVAEQEAVAVYCDGLFLELLTASCHCIYWKNEREYRFDRYDKSDLASANELPAEVFEDRQARLNILSYQVEHYEQGFLIVDGICSGRYEPGRYHFWRSRNRQVEMLKADLRAQLLEVSGQEILTSDKASLRLNYQLQYRIVDAEKALLQESDLTSRLYLGVQLALRTFVGGVTLDELLASKAAVNDYVQQALAALQDELGVTILDGGLRDIILPGDMKEIMNRVLVAEKQAQANTILRRDETAATRALLNSAKLMEDHPMLLRLKEMEYLERIAERVDSLSLSGGEQLLEQLRKLFVARNN